MLYTCGYSLENIVKALNKSNFYIEGRMEKVSTNISNKDAYVDYAHTPDALENVLKTLNEKYNKVIVVFGCGGQRDVSKRPEMGKIAAKYADYIVITNDNPREEDPKSIICDIVKGIANNHNNYMQIKNRTNAIKHGVDFLMEQSLKHKSVLLVAGKGHEKIQKIHNNQTIVFDDVQVIKNILKDTLNV